MAGSRPTVIVVDDDASIRKALERLLRAKGYVVMCVDTIAALRALVPLPEPSCVLADILLNGESGLSIPAVLETDQANTPVVFMSASDDQGDIQTANALGSVPCLRKPFEEDNLFSALKTAIASKRRLPSDFNSIATGEIK